MGLYEWVDEEIDSRPVYFGGRGRNQYLYFSSAAGSWMIDTNRHDTESGVAASDDATCPTDVASFEWAVHNGSHWLVDSNVTVSCASATPPFPPSPPTTPPSPPSICSNTCHFSSDAVCDDGGEGAEYSSCNLGSDCSDCGVRELLATVPPPPSAPTPSSPSICSNTCEYRRDDDCDDGGKDSHYSVCAFGTDCLDCGARFPTPSAPPTPPPPPGVCNDDCSFPRDGECDDGGPGSEYSDCNLGTDCSDCGARTNDATVIPPPPSPPPCNDNDGGATDSYGDTCQDYLTWPEWCGGYDDNDFTSSSMCCACGGGQPVSQASTLCTDACHYPSDGLCDDGGAGAQYDECALGTDCTDCGDRLPHPSPPPLPPPNLCTDTCHYESDGDCDDGGQGAEYSSCELGTDCADCGSRVASSSLPPSLMPSSASPAPPCLNSDNGATDSYNDDCAFYSTHPQWCNTGDDSDFTSNTMCCVCGGGLSAVPPSLPPPIPCEDSSDGATDMGGYGCADYTGYTHWCGSYDDTDFSSSTMCCACGGGRHNVAHSPPSPPPPPVCNDTDTSAGSNSAVTDRYEGSCNDYRSNTVWCGNYDDDDFSSNTMCCACGGGSTTVQHSPPPPPAPPPCNDTAAGATDSYGDPCSDYLTNPGWCGGYDDEDFSSNDMCCACGGGYANTPPPSPNAPVPAQPTPTAPPPSPMPPKAPRGMREPSPPYPLQTPSSPGLSPPGGPEKVAPSSPGLDVDAAISAGGNSGMVTEVVGISIGAAAALGVLSAGAIFVICTRKKTKPKLTMRRKKPPLAQPATPRRGGSSPHKLACDSDEHPSSQRTSTGPESPGRGLKIGIFTRRSSEQGGQVFGSSPRSPKSPPKSPHSLEKTGAESSAEL